MYDSAMSETPNSARVAIPEGVPINRHIQRDATECSKIRHLYPSMRYEESSYLNRFRAGEFELGKNNVFIEPYPTNTHCDIA